MTTDQIPAPWTLTQVAQLNAYQTSGWHPYTCGTVRCWQWHTIPNEMSIAVSTTLIAEPDGWRCPKCNYRQTWAGRILFEIGKEALEGKTPFGAIIHQSQHHENCDVFDKNPEGIKKPCNCGGFK